MEMWPYVVLIVTFVSVLAGVVFWAHRSLKKREALVAAWDAYARAIGTLRRFYHTAPGTYHRALGLEGTFRNVPVQCAFVFARSGRHGRRAQTRVVAACRGALPRGFMLSHSIGGRANIRPALQRNYVSLGDAPFDDTFLVSGDEAACRALLSDPAVRGTLIDLACREPALKVAAGHVVIEKLDQLTTPEELHAMLDVVSLAVLGLEQASAKAQ